ncbi:MAG: hypothetical protein GY702_20810 [Desulfobulbaceae bacterium]|nr:hypothetical protein [Desulfobulbaceae bacterium]
MIKLPEINFTLRFTAKSHIPAELVAKIILVVEKSILQIEKVELVDIQSQFEELSPEQVNLLRSKLQTGELKGLFLQKADSGSIVLSGILAGIAGLAFSLLQQTLAEDIKAVWPSTDISKRFRKFLLFGSKNKIDKLTDLIKINIYDTISVESEGIEIEFYQRDKIDNPSIYLKVNFTKVYPMTRGELNFLELDAADVQKPKEYPNDEGSESHGPSIKT